MRRMLTCGLAVVLATLVGAQPGSPTVLAPYRDAMCWTPLTVAHTFTCALLVEPDRGRRVRVIDRGLGMLDRYLATEPTDGACDEGPSYWLHSADTLLSGFELLPAATAGAFD